VQVDEGLVSADAVDGLMKQHQVTSSALHASGQLWDDGVIRPQDTRKVRNIALHSSRHS
jgi:acetyl-CoA carboxylase carboxyltransferase component